VASFRSLEHLAVVAVAQSFAMLSMKPQCKLADAKKYFEEHLCVGDYYTEGQSVSGQWFGMGAEELGLNGVTQAEDFLRLCDNMHPRTGERLTQRQNTMRVEVDADGKSHKAANRRARNQVMLSAPDQLRQRVAYALSQIMVISDNDSNIANGLEGSSSYYDMLARLETSFAFGSNNTTLG
jgi:hypothetical protein